MRSDNVSSNPSVMRGAKTMGEVVAERLSRRGFLTGALASSALVVAGCRSVADVVDETMVPGQADTAAKSVFSFPEIARGMDETHHLADDHVANVLIRWGDPLFADSPAFDPMNQTAAAQRRQFGYNNDYIGFVELPVEGNEEGRGLLCVNHEYTSTNLMLPGVMASYPASMTKALCEIEMAAHGGSVVEIVKRDGAWSVVVGSKYNRRITADTTPMRVSGPAAGHKRLQTREDPSGLIVAGTLNNCAGGITPWGTYLMAEENFNSNFLGELPKDHPEYANHERYNVPGGRYQWGRYFDRYDISKEPSEPNRYGWVVEVDPMDPNSTPRKRSALGRFKHEGAESVVAPDGRVVVYTGDDQRFDYVYKFVTARAYDPDNRAANMDLLDEGTLYVARFDADGTVAWLPLVFGTGPLTPENGFESQADVVIEARRAGDLLGATPMDRPEDVEPDAKTGRVFVMLTNNSRRSADQVDAANPRANNTTGQIVEITEPNGDFTSTTSRWELLVVCGDPSDPASGSKWNAATSENGWFGSPDNCAVDPKGRLWVSTDGNENTGAADGLWAMETDGPLRGTGRNFFRTPVGAELCGPRFTADGRSLFVAVQHPGDGDGATFETPTTRWPDFADGVPPRPSVVVIARKDGGMVGG